MLNEKKVLVNPQLFNGIIPTALTILTKPKLKATVDLV